MAEAHSAAAISFSITHEGWNLQYDQELLYDIYCSFRRNYKRRIGRFKNNFKAGIYPAHPGSLVFTICLITGLALCHFDVSYGLIGWLQRRTFGEGKLSLVLCGTAVAALVWFMVIQLIRVTIKMLLLYKGWMYERARNPSMLSKCWLALVHLIFRSKPMLYSFQGALPRLPLPSVETTLELHLKSMRPLVNDAEYERLAKLSEEFKTTIAPKLQRYLMLKSYTSANYVTDWWEKYVYLSGRSPIMVNSNYYGVDTLFVYPSHQQASRAANLGVALLEFRRLIDRQELKPIMIFGVPLCSFQYERMFNSCRIPGEECDSIVHWEDSQHLAVFHTGCWWKVPIHNGRRLLSPVELEHSFRLILDSNEKPAPGEDILAALTAGDRIPWAKVRKAHLRTGLNKASLDTIERAAFVLVLDDDEYDYDEEVPSKLDHWAHAMLHGNGKNRWFDKSFNFIVGRNGRVGCNGEHSCYDAPCFAHMMEFAYFSERDLYDENGYCQGELAMTPPAPTHLKWNLPQEVIDTANESHVVAKKILEDVDMALLVYKGYGKGFIKTCKVSPDGFIQMALQLTTFRDQGKFFLTYEASMTRLYREGRTETVRTVTPESCAFVRAMEDPSATKEECRTLLRAACNLHQTSYINSMCGKGIDRHMFALFVVSKYLEVDSPFLKEVLSEPWRLSTSQTPHQQTDLCDLTKNPQYVSAGGGFGPVANDGYGVSYVVGGEDIISFHISSKKAYHSTDSNRFRENLKRSLADIKAIFQDS